MFTGIDFFQKLSFGNVVSEFASVKYLLIIEQIKKINSSKLY